MLRILWSIFRQNTYFIIGLIIGLGLSILLIPLVETDCIGGASRRVRPRIHSHKTDDYEPRINLAAKPKMALKPGDTLVRPRFYTSELGIREKLFVGILTTPQTIGTLGIAMNKTTAHLVDKIMYFIDAPSAQKINVSSLKLPGIVGFTDTRDVLKPFHLIKYICDNFLEDYDYFFISRDSTYIQARSLYEFAKKVSVSEDVYCGNPSAIDKDSAYCSLDAGILLSNSVVRKLHNSLEWCVKTVTGEDDSENFGRCIVHACSLQCSSNVQGLTKNTFFIESGKDVSLFTVENLKNKVFEESLTVYPMKSSDGFYKAHSYFSKLMIAKNQIKIDELRHSIINTSYSTPKGRKGVTWPVGNQPPTIPETHFDILRWDYFTKTHIYLDNDFSNLKLLTGAEKQDIDYVMNKSISKIEAKYEGALKFRRFINGYRRFDPARGMDYILDVAFRDTTVGKTVHKRIEVCKPLGKVEMLPVPYVTENVRINLLVTVRKNERSRAMSFLRQYSVNVMEKKDVMFLMLVFIYNYDDSSKGDEDIYKELKDTAVQLSNKFDKDGNRVKWLSIRLPPPSENYNMIHESLMMFAIADLAVLKFNRDALLLLGQTNMEVRGDFFNRIWHQGAEPCSDRCCWVRSGQRDQRGTMTCVFMVIRCWESLLDSPVAPWRYIICVIGLRVRMNTIQQYQVFSAIPFTEYYPDIVYNEELPRPAELDINKNYGHYDSKSTSFISFYAKDYIEARKAIVNILPIVKVDHDILSLVPLRDTEMLANYTSFAVNGIYSMFVRASNLHVFRAVEPGLRLKHSERYCIPLKPGESDDLVKAAIYKNCIESRNFNLGTRSHLARLILEYEAENDKTKSI